MHAATTIKHLETLYDQKYHVSISICKSSGIMRYFAGSNWIRRMQHQKLIVKNMSCHCCLKLVRRILSEHGIDVLDVQLGEVKIHYDDERISLDDISTVLEEEGFELVLDKERQLVEQIKSAVIDLVHHSTFNSMVRNSDFLIEKFNLSYQYISSIFSKQEHITLEKFIILQKIEKVKELIQYGELTLSEIAFMMGYSSVQYLSTQFKNVTGVSVSEYKKNPSLYRRPIDGLTE